MSTAEDKLILAVTDNSVTYDPTLKGVHDYYYYLKSMSFLAIILADLFNANKDLTS